MHGMNGMHGMHGMDSIDVDSAELLTVPVASSDVFALISK